MHKTVQVRLLYCVNSCKYYYNAIVQKIVTIL